MSTAIVKVISIANLLHRHWRCVSISLLSLPYFALLEVMAFRWRIDLGAELLLGCVGFGIWGAAATVIAAFQRRLVCGVCGVLAICSATISLARSMEVVREIGVKSIALKVVVYDAETSDPVRNAIVEIRENSSAGPRLAGTSEAITLGDGTATLDAGFTYTATIGTFRRTGWIRIGDAVIVVDAKSYCRCAARLSAHTGSGLSLGAATPSDIVLLIVKESRK